MRQPFLILVAIILCCGSAYSQTTTLHGRVLDAVTREPLDKALISIRSLQRETTTNSEGSFSLQDIPAGRIELYFTTIGYTLLRREFDTSALGDRPIEILLGPQTITSPDAVTVVADVFELPDSSVSEHTLSQTELRNVADVLVNDPLRSVQVLPGVAAGDDFNAEFAVRGAGFRNVGFYIDGVLTEQSFHTVKDITDGGSVTVLNGNLLESLSLFSSAAPARFGDRTGAVLDVETRNGNAERIHARSDISATGMSHTAEGPIGRSRKVTWIASARQSYAAWLIRRLSNDPGVVGDMGLTDAQGNLSYMHSSRSRFTVSALLGRSGVNQERDKNQLGTNSFLLAGVKSGIVNARWRWVQARFINQSSIYISDSASRNTNVNNELLFRSFTEDVGARDDAGIQINSRHRFESGIVFRQLRELGERRRFSSGSGFAFTNHYSTSTWQQGIYVNHTWKIGDRVSVGTGGRLDHFAATGESVGLPRIGASFRVLPRTTISAAYGQFAQFPDFASLYGEFGVRSLHSERSEHRVVSIEQRLSDKIRVRTEFYDAKESSLIYSEETHPRIVNGKIVNPHEGPVLRNTLAGYSRGVEIYLQRRSANRLSGWISYSLGYARFRDSQSGAVFDGDFDQRHTANLFASYRLTSNLSLSSKFRYGSNFPVAGFYRTTGSRLVLTELKNITHLPVYSRLDLRADYAFHFNRWKLTLNTEITNALARRNVRFDDLDRVTSSGQVLFRRETLLPFLPSAGVGIEF